MCIKCATILLVNSEDICIEYVNPFSNKDRKYIAVMEMKTVLRDMKEYVGIPSSDFFKLKYRVQMERMNMHIREYEKKNFSF